MDRNTIIGFILIGIVFFFFYLFNQDNLEQQEAIRRAEDSIAQIEIARQDSIKEPTAPPQIVTQLEEEELNAQPIDTVINDSTQQKKIRELGLFTNATKGEEEFSTIESDFLKITFSNKGGRIYKVDILGYKTYDSNSITLINGEETVFDYQFASEGQIIQTKDLYFDKVTSLTTSGDHSQTISFRLYAGTKTKYLEQRYTVNKGSYMIDYELNFVGMDEVIQKNSNDITLAWQSNIIRQERSIKPERRYTTLYYKFAGDEVDWLSQTSKDDEEKISTPIEWIAYKQQFFSISLIAKNNFGYANLSLVANNESDTLLKTLTSELSIPFNHKPSSEFPMKFYIGPNHYNTLKSYDKELESLIPLGWPIVKQINKYVIIFIFNLLNDHIQNYGIIIFILTLFIKIVLSPLTYKTYLSGAKMKILKPEIDELKKKHPNDQQKVSMEQMKLFRQAGVNPLGGCFPMLLQMPVLIAMYYFFPTSIELRQKSFLWADDLSTYDSIFTFHDGFSIPFYGDHISLFTLLMCVTTIIYTKMNSQMTGASAQMGQMKMMTYLMPIMIAFHF